MRIEVTAADIAAGTPNHCSRCPVAVAVTRATGVPDVAVCRTIEVGPGRRYLTPPAVWQRIRQFDIYGTMEPFGFDLPDPT